MGNDASAGGVTRVLVGSRCEAGTVWGSHIYGLGGPELDLNHTG